MIATQTIQCLEEVDELGRNGEHTPSTESFPEAPRVNNVSERNTIANEQWRLL